MDDQSGKSTEEEEIGAEIGELGIETLVWGWRRDTLSLFQRKIKHNEMSDQLFVVRMMLVANRE